MNILLWVLQVALAFLCIPGGIFKIIKFDELKKGVTSMRELPKGLWLLFGAFEVIAGLCLIMPGAMLGLPTVTAVAAAAVAVESVLVSAIYIRHRDFAPMKFTIVMALIAVFIAYGRFELAPF